MVQHSKSDSDWQEADRPWLTSYPEGVRASLDYPQRPVWWLLEKAATEHPNRIACHYYDQQLTYRELWVAARQAAAMMIDRGIRPGDRVGVLLPNTPEALIAIYGTWMAGGVVVSLSPLMVADEISGLLRATNCRMVIGLDLLAPLVREADIEGGQLLYVTLQDRLPRWQRFGYAFARVHRLGFRAISDPTTVSSFNDEIAKSDPNIVGFEAGADAPAFILPTGGTTGAPKAVVLTHGNLLSNAWQLREWSGGRIARERYLAVIPFFHSYGLTTCATGGVAIAATLILHHRFIPRVVLRLIAEHRPTFFPAVPAMLVPLVEMLRQKPSPLVSLNGCMSGGAPLDATIANEFSKFSGASVVEGYGLSEASPVTHAGPLDGTARIGSIGLPLPDTMARIVDAETGTTVMPTGEAGELIVRGPQVMAGYWNDPEATARVIRDGWLYTGDIAVCDEDGFFRVVDRKKDVIITSGFNVYPADVEQVLRRCVGVSDVAIVGVSCSQRGQVVKAFIAADNSCGFDRKVFDKHVVENLAKHKRPRLVEVLDGDLPRNFLGKVLRRKLRDQHAQQQLTPEAAPAAS